MESAIKNRSELNEKDCWDLTPLYADAAEWEKDFAKLDDLLAAFLTFKGRLAESPAVLRDAFLNAKMLSVPRMSWTASAKKSGSMPA